MEREHLDKDKDKTAASRVHICDKNIDCGKKQS